MVAGVMAPVLCYKMLTESGIAMRDPVLTRVLAIMTVTFAAAGSQMIQHASREIMKKSLV